MKLIFKVEIDSTEWDSETFDDSCYDPSTLKSMLFDRFYDLITDIIKVNDFSDYIEYEQDDKIKENVIETLKQELSEEQYFECIEMLEILRKEIYANMGYKRLNGAYCNYELIDYDNEVISVMFTHGIQDTGDGYSVKYHDQYKISRNKITILPNDIEKDIKNDTDLRNCQKEI
ncbi:MAG: hypothetical protein JXA99_15270 [Candidatus Lokiarchaeota archaeon]|nr:hypothetical protein [Candidatus Lokiarchaeota archaeon]